MKTPFSLFVPVLASLLLQACVAPPAPPSDPPTGGGGSGEKSTPADYHAVRDAELFSIGGTGYAGTINPAETALRKVLRSSTAEEDCRRLLKEGTPAGQVYALLGLKTLNAGSYKSAVGPFKASKKEVTTMAGCMMYPQAMSELVRKIDEGVYR